MNILKLQCSQNSSYCIQVNYACQYCQRKIYVNTTASDLAWSALQRKPTIIRATKCLTLVVNHNGEGTVALTFVSIAASQGNENEHSFLGLLCINHLQILLPTFYD
jgi:hypothetical protein